MATVSDYVGPALGLPHSHSRADASAATSDQRYFAFDFVHDIERALPQRESWRDCDLTFDHHLQLEY